jgi:penicillin-binding protein 2
MKFEDDSQNLRVRLRVLQILILLLISVLAVRLYVLQVMKGTYYSERAENQRIRLLPIPAPRGVIFDRNEKILVDSRPIYNVILSRDDIKNIDLNTLVEPLTMGLNIDPDYLRERFNQIQTQPAFESIRIKEDATRADVAWVDAHALEFPQLRVEAQPQRRYPENGTLAHVLGYVGEISPEQLEQPRYKDKGYKPGDIIGREGIEAVYDHYLRGRDGYRKVVVDSRGRIQDVIEEVEPQPGQDLVTTIDLDLQLVAEEQLRNSPKQRGVVIAMDPNNGEVMTLASYPTFDPNLFSQRITSKEGRAEYNELVKNPRTPLINRAIQGIYPPGSTWKIPMAASGLMQGAITTQNSNLVCGGGITIGNKFTRCMGSHGTPDVRYAIMKSCDGYFYRLGLKMGIDGIMKMVDDFDINKRTGIDLPHELVSQTPNLFKPMMDKRGQPWKDIDTVYASFGQVYDFATPIAMLRAVAGIGVGGRLYVPHLLKEARAVSEVGPFAARPAQRFDRPDPKIVPLTAEYHDAVVKGMWSVVNDAGTAARIRMAGFDIAGKTGTAQVVGLGKDVGENKDHAWFVSFAPAYKPEISAIALIENSGFGGVHAAPAVRAVYDVYYRKTRNEEPPGAVQVAQNQKSAGRAATQTASADKRQGE